MNWRMTLRGLLYENTHGSIQQARLLTIDEIRNHAREGVLREMADDYFNSDMNNLVAAGERLSRSMQKFIGKS